MEQDPAWICLWRSLKLRKDSGVRLAVIEDTLGTVPALPVHAFDVLLDADREARAVAAEQVAVHA